MSPIVRVFGDGRLSFADTCSTLVLGRSLAVFHVANDSRLIPPVLIAASQLGSCSLSYRMLVRTPALTLKACEPTSRWLTDPAASQARLAS
jgi:hypothetical protein